MADDDADDILSAFAVSKWRSLNHSDHNSVNPKKIVDDFK